MKIRLDLALFCIGAALCGRAVLKLARYEAFQHNPRVVMAAQRVLPGLMKAGEAQGLRVVGRVEIPRLKLSTLVVDGDDDESLALAAGHVAGTVALGTNGNSAIAGHRDSSFRQLRGIRIGDVVRVVVGRKNYEYIVRSTQVVSPDDMQVLANTQTSVLTLITCYPFRFIGSAPKRFVVRAELLVT